MMTEEDKKKLYESGILAGGVSTVLTDTGQLVEIRKTDDGGYDFGDYDTSDESLIKLYKANVKPPADPSQVLLDDLIAKQKKDVKTDIAILGGGEALKLATVLGGFILDPTLKAQRKQARKGIDEKQLALDARRDAEKVTQAAGATGRQVEQALEGAVAADQGTKSLKELQTIQRSVGETVAQQRKAGMEFVVQQDAIRRAQALAEQKDVEAAAVVQRAAMLKATTDALGSVQKGLAGVLGSKGAKVSNKIMLALMAADDTLTGEQVKSLNKSLEGKNLTAALINTEAGKPADDPFGKTVLLNLRE